MGNGAMSKIRKIQDILVWLILSFAFLLLVVYWSKFFQAEWLLLFVGFFAGICLFCVAFILLILSFIQKRFRKIVLSSVALYLCFLLFDIPFMEISLARQRAEPINEKFNDFYKLLDEYQKNHKGMLPQPATWCDELMKSNPKIKKSDFQLTFYKRKICFVYNKALENTYFSSLSPKTVLMFTTYESDNNWNLTGNESLFKFLFENTKPYNLPYLMFADGHVIGIPSGGPHEVDKPLIWEPALYKNSSEPNKIDH
jgi:ABC-type transport system involved in multi-copper enzyme maturation permease subunit